MKTAELTITVLLVDDDDDVRSSTARIVRNCGYACIEVASSAAARAVLAVDHDVAVVLCDVAMPGGSGIQLLAEIQASFVDVAVVMITGTDDPHVAELTFDLGAFGYVTKPFASNELVNSLASAVRRRALERAQREHVTSLERTIAARSPIATEALPRPAPTDGGSNAGISDRERQVLQLMAEGLLNKQIAARLGLRLNTVRNHSQSILRKLHAHSRQEAVATALRERIVAFPA